MKLSIILPAFNEIESLPHLVRAISKVVGKVRYEIIVVDDHSPDGTAKLIKNMFRRNNHVRVVENSTRIGLAPSILRGITYATGTHVLVMDSDFNHHPKYILHFLPFANAYNIIIGSRYIPGGGMENRPRYYMSSLYNGILRSLLKLPSHDNLSGYFLMKKNLLLSLPLKKIFRGYGDYFIRLLFLLKQKNCTIHEIPVYYQNRFAGESKSKLLPMFFDYTKTILELKRTSL